MTDLISTSAFGDTAARTAQFGMLRLCEDTGLGLASLAVPQGQAAPAPFGLTLPGPGGWTSGDRIAAFWTGPDQWMIEGTGQGHDDFAALIGAEVSAAAVTEQTDGWVAINITGPAGQIVALLERLVNLAPEATAPGRATRTGLHHMNVFLIRRAPDQLTILGMRSAAGSLWHAVAETAKRLTEAAT